MSESMTTVEIEDVLSSIRRLVSEDLRPTHRLVSAALKSGANKLILTPALRIVSDERLAPSGQVGLMDDQRDQAPFVDVDETSQTLQSAAIVPVFGSVRLSDKGTTSDALSLADAAAGVPDANFLATAMSRINGLTGELRDVAPHPHSETIEAVVAAVGAAVGPDEWEVDGGEPAPQVAAWEDADWNTVSSVDVAVSHAPAPAPVLVLHAEAVSHIAELAEPLLLTDRPAAFEVTDAALEGDVSVLAEDTIVFHAESVSEMNPASDATQISADAVDFDADSEFLNEDLLREIVRDMIREELQGTLGERITRNVRKLVRAEINRSLAAHHYDEKVSRA